MKSDEWAGSVIGASRGRVSEEHPVLRERIEHGRAGVRVAVGAKPIGARGVERDDDEIQRADGIDAVRPAWPDARPAGAARCGHAR